MPPKQVLPDEHIVAPQTTVVPNKVGPQTAVEPYKVVPDTVVPEKVPPV
jgi:hypothetical protein